MFWAVPLLGSDFCGFAWVEAPKKKFPLEMFFIAQETCLGVVGSAFTGVESL